MNGAVPTYIRCRIGIGTGKVCIPGAAYAVVATVLPADIPAVDCAGAIVSDTDAGNETRTPVITDDIFTT